VLLLFAVALVSLSAALGLAAKRVETASNTPTFLTLLPLLSSAFVAARTMPDRLRQFAEYQPFTPVTETVRGLVTDTPTGTHAIAAVTWSIDIAVVCYVWSVGLYGRRRAEPRQRHDTKRPPRIHHCTEARDSRAGTCGEWQQTRVRLRGPHRRSLRLRGPCGIVLARLTPATRKSVSRRRADVAARTNAGGSLSLHLDRAPPPDADCDWVGVASANCAGRCGGRGDTGVGSVESSYICSTVGVRDMVAGATGHSFNRRLESMTDRIRVLCGFAGKKWS
jgi:hypothetical protein